MADSRKQFSGTLKRPTDKQIYKSENVLGAAPNQIMLNYLNYSQESNQIIAPQNRISKRQHRRTERSSMDNQDIAAIELEQWESKKIADEQH